MNRIRLILILVALSGSAFAHPASQAIRVPGGSYSQVTPQTLNAQLKSKDFLLINVHIPYEGELQNTDLFLPFDQMNATPVLPRAKNAEIVVYCRSGSMSALAVRALVRRGYTNVRELRGGMNAWTAAGFELKSLPEASFVRPDGFPAISFSGKGP
ncbi:rhodanese-like domain-containing protein [Deinococcus marmoris]|uniref:rhodanese-like domain-containing protein n=1 Tax=Deinococcus marmoris TaxID=249408 RepID=UPI00096A2C0C|nr:rhodanese-like domain-containing protein [Deinococcus marmoris]